MLLKITNYVILQVDTQMRLKGDDPPTLFLILIFSRCFEIKNFVSQDCSKIKRQRNIIFKKIQNIMKYYLFKNKSKINWWILVV